MMDLHRLEIDLMRDEGFSSEPYRDSLGFWTIGYGSRNVMGEAVTSETKPLRSDQARILLRADLYRAILDAEELFPRIREMRHTRQEVLANMAYNLGHYKLSRFVKMRAAADLLDFQEMANQMVDSRWHFQVGGRAVRLEMIMRTGRK